jgi:alpha-N-arabinofuranosidase
MNSTGAAFVHNLFTGKIDVVDYDSRLTPYMKPHSSYVAALHDNPGGDVQFVNNLFVNGSNVSQYSKALLPVVFEGNVYTKGAIRLIGDKDEKRFGEMNQKAKEQLQKYKEQAAVEKEALVAHDFDAIVNLLNQDGNKYLEIAFDPIWLKQKRILVTSQTLTKARVPNLPYENVDGSTLRIDTDYNGRKRNISNVSPGPFEINVSGKQKIKL